jgi:hypothetical protein
MSFIGRLSSIRVAAALSDDRQSLVRCQSTGPGVEVLIIAGTEPSIHRPNVLLTEEIVPALVPVPITVRPVT